MGETKTERVSIRLTKSLRRRLEKLAAKDQRTLSSYVEIILKEHTDRRREK